MNGKQKQPKRGKIGDRYREVKLNNENIEKKNKKEITKIAFLAVILLIVTVGTSYALFNVLVKSDKDTEIIAGTFKVNFEDGNEIILNNASPMSDEEGLNTTGYKFTVDNSGTIDAKYNVSLEERDSKEMTLDKKYVKYSIKENDGSWSEPQLLSNGLVLRKDKLLATSMKDTYELKLWLSENAPNETQGKRFDTKVVISAVQGNAVLEISGQPVINIANTNVTINEGDEFIEPVPTEIFDGNGSKIDNANIEKTYEYFDGVNTVAVDRIDTSKIGVYYIYYTVNANGKSGCTVVTVNVNKKDNGNPPVIQLNGDATQNIKNGDNYEELGASATDEEDENLSDDVVVIGTVNTLIDDTYIVKYIVEDKDGNIASITRTVNVYSSRDNVVIKLSDPTIKNNRNVINFSAISSSNDIVGYYYSNNDSKPNKKDFLQVDKTKHFNKEVKLFKNGTYYFWIIDSKGNIYSDKKLISNLDTKGPVCTFNDVEYITTGKKVIELSCTDDTGIKEKFLQTSNFKISDSNVAKIIDVSAGEKIENGYKFYITLDTLKSGEFNIQLKGKSISDIFYNYNESVQKTIKVKTISSSDVTIENGEYNPDTGDLGKITLEIPNRAKIDIKDKIGDLKIVSENTDIVSVTEDGYLNPESVGKTTVTVTDQGSGAIILLNVTVIKNVKVTYVKYGKGVDSIATITSKNTTCKIDPDSTDKSCSVIMPSFTTTSPYEVIGWSSNPDLHNDIKKVGDSLNVTDDITLYSISAIPEKKYSVSWESNGATLVDGESQCIIEAIYNDDEVVNSCKVKKPTIIGSSNTPIVVGFNTDSNAHKALFTSEDNDGYLDVDSSNNGSKYYAITKNNEKKYTATFTHNGYAVNYFEPIEKQCTINASYNGAAQNSTCSIEQPTISLIDQDQYTMIGWNTDKNAHTGIGEDNKVNISSDVELYPITKSVAKNISATFEKSGVGVISIDSTMQSCTIEEIYNPTEPIPDSCSIPIPNFTVKDGYTAIGWNSNQKAHEKESNIYTDDNKLLISNNTTYYSISKKNAITLTADFDANGAKISDEHKACTLEEVYNDENQATECTIIAPTITRDNFIVDGYNLDDSSNITFNSSDSINLTSNKKDNDNFIESGKTWKAQTHKDINVDFNANGAQLSSTKQTCVIKNKNTNCSITSPTIERSGYEIVGYVDENNKDKDPTILSGSSLVWKQNTEKSFDDSQVYYAITYKVLNANFTYYASDNTANKLKANNNKVIVRKLGNTNKNKITETEQCTVYNKNNECSIDVPEKVSESVGPSEIKYAGLARNVNSIDDLITSKAISIKDSSDYYAIYQEKVHPKFYYYNGKETVYDDSITATRLAILKEKDGDYIIIQEAFDVPNIVKESNGLDNAVFYGVSNTKSSTKLADNISTANEEYYAIYKGTWKVNYEKDSSISAIGSTISSCNNYQTTDGQIYSQEGENCSINLPSITPKEGYTVSGWYEGDTKVGNPGDSYTIGGNKTLTAKADINKYTVKYDCTTNGGTCSIADKSLNYGETADLTPTATKEGYDFLGWNTDSKATTALTTGPVVKSNTVLYAIYRKTETATFNYYNDGKINTVKDECTIYNNEKSCIAIPKVVTDSIGPNNTTYKGISKNVNSFETTSVSTGTYYAVYQTPVKQYYENNNSGTSKTIYRNSYFATTSNMTTVLTNEVSGINNMVLSSGTKEVSGLSVENIATKGITVEEAANKTENSFYTTYKENITSSFYYYDGTNQSETTTTGVRYYNYDLTKTADSNISIPDVVISSKGIDSGNYQGLSNAVSSKVLIDNITTANKKYYAVYKGTWKVNYAKDSSVSAIGSNTSSCDNYQTTNGSKYSQEGENCSINLPSITPKEGYTVSGWYDGDTKVGNPGDSYTIGGNKTLTAKADINKYTVKYDCTTNGGTCSIADKSLNYGETADLTPTATKEGYDFLGWNTDSKATTALTTGPVVKSNTVLYAIYRKTTSISLDSKTAEYTGSAISANQATVADGDSSAITYKYYTDSSCNTQTTTSSGASSAGTAPIDVGTYYVKASTTATNGKTVSSSCVPHTITTKKISVAWGTNTEFSYNEKEQAPSYTVTNSISNEVINTSQTKATLAGNYTSAVSITSVTGGRGKKTNYELTNNTKTYTIKTATGYVTLGATSGTVSYGTTSKTFTVTGSHGGTLSVSDDNATATASISGNTVTISNLGSLDAGTVVKVTVTSAAISNKYTAASQTYTLTIGKASATNPTLTAYNKAYDGSSHTIGVSGGSGGTIKYSTDKTNWSTEKPTYKDYTNGAKTIYVKVFGDSNHNDTDIISSTVTISKATGYVTLGATSGTVSYGTTSKTFTVTGSHGGTLSVSDDNATATASISGNTVTISNLGSLNAGTVIKVTVTSAESTNYKAASQTYTLTIGRASATNPTLTAYNKAYDGSSHTIGVSGGSGGTIKYSTDKTNWSTEKPTYKDYTNGAKTIYVKVFGDSNHNDTDIISSTVTISKATGYVTLGATSGTVSYGTTSKTFTVTGSHGGTLSVSDDNATATASISGNTVTISSIGSLDAGTVVKVTVKAAESTNYTAASQTYTLTIGKASATNPTLTAYNKAYDGSSHTIGVSGGSGGTIKYSTDKTNWSTEKPTYKDYTNGAKTIYVKVFGDSNHNDTDIISSTVTISKATGYVTLGATSGTVSYGTTSKTFTVTGSHGGTLSVSDDNATATASISGNTVTISNLGSLNAGTVIKVTVTSAESTNYKAASQTYTLTIGRASATNPTLTAYNKAYDGSSHTIGVSGGSGGTIKYSTDKTNWSTEKPTYKDYTNGAKTIYVKVFGDSNHNDTDIISSTVTISKATGYVTLGATSGTVSYGTTSKTFTVTGSHGGTLSVSDDNATATASISGSTVTISRLGGLDAGTVIKVTVTSAESTNYTSASATYTLTITKAAGNVTLGATSGTVSYGTTSKTFTVTGSHGGTLSVSDDNATATASISGSTVTISNLGSLNAGTVIKVTVTSAESTNYKAASATYTLTITKKDGEITLSDPSVTVPYGTEKYSFTASGSGAVRVSDDNATATTSISGSTVTISNIGSLDVGTVVTVTVTAAESTNYKATQKTFTLGICKAANPLKVTGVTETFPYSGSLVSVSNNKAGTTIYYSTTKALNSSNYTTGTTSINATMSAGAGTYTIYYYQPGNNNYDAKSGSTTATIKVGTVNVEFRKGTGVSSLGSTSASCTISNSTCCAVSVPTYTLKSGYKDPYWYYTGTKFSASSITSFNICLGASSYATLYGTDTQRPEVSIVSADIENCYYGQTCTGEALFKVTDNTELTDPYGKVGSYYKAEGTDYENQASGPGYNRNGVIYIPIKVNFVPKNNDQSGIHGVIPAGTVCDDSGNCNVAYSATIGMIYPKESTSPYY